MQIWWSQCTAYGLTGWPPDPFNLCSNAGSTHTSISQRQPLDMSTCTQLLWSPPCCSSVSGSWQTSYSPGHLYVEQQLFFFRSPESSLPWGAMLNFQWPVSMRECESDDTKFNTPAPHSHQRVTWHRGGKMTNWAQFGHFHLRVDSLLWSVV